MKCYPIPITDKSINNFFRPVRSKGDIIRLLMTTVKYIISTVRIDRVGNNFIYIIIDEMNRFVYQSENKIFSVSTPFSVIEEENTFKFYTKNIEEIDSTITSGILSIVNDENFYNLDINDFDSLIEKYLPKQNGAWGFLMELLTLEDSYLRFDKDPENADPARHPQYHLDINYTKAGTYKIGSHNALCIHFFHELINNKYNSKYLEVENSPAKKQNLFHLVTSKTT